MARKSPARNRYVKGSNLSFASATLEVAGTTDSPVMVTDDVNTIIATLDVSAVSGSPTLDVKLQTTDDGTTWRDVASFAQKTGVSSEVKAFTGLGSQCRWHRVLAGTATPKATYTITGYSK